MSWSIILPTFMFIFIAALPGRTTFVMLLLATRSRALPVFAGSVLAFLIQAMFSVFLGSLLGKFPQRWVNLGSGILFLFFTYRMWRERNTIEAVDLQGTSKLEKTFSVTARVAFLSVFAAEWGDVSQLAIASVAAHYTDHTMVWVSASLALALTAVVAITVGVHAHKVIHPKLIHMISIFVFGLVGIYYLVSSIPPLSN